MLVIKSEASETLRILLPYKLLGKILTLCADERLSSIVALEK
jgi:hypothetical protein